MKKVLLSALVISLAVFAVCAQGQKEGTVSGVKEYRLATDAALDYPTTKALVKFADRVEELSQGKMKIKIYESSILGDEVSYQEQLQLGTVDFAKLSIGTINGLYQDLQVFNLPFLFKNGDEMWKVLNSEVGQWVLNGLNEYKIQGIGFTDNGSRCFYTKFPVNSIKDFSSKKIRVQANKIMTSMVKGLGGNPVNVSANEVYSALQTGVADGGENNMNTILTESYYEIAKYVTLDNHTTGMDVICCNLDLWKSFSDSEKAIIKQAMAEATTYDRQIWNESINAALKKLADNGAVISTPSNEVLDSFRNAMAPLYSEYSPKLGKWIDAINKVLGR